MTCCEYCPNCESSSPQPIRDVFVSVKKIKTPLCYCSSCDFLYLPNPTWLQAAYNHEFFADTGHIQRNIRNASSIKLLLNIYLCIARHDNTLAACDLGTGLGVFPRLMRDSGFNFWGTDSFSRMPLIQPFVNPPFAPKLLTAFEVVEHVPSLSKFLRASCCDAEMIVFSTLIRWPGEIPSDDWWYYAFQIGQHVSFHSSKSISVALEIAGIPRGTLMSHGHAEHAIARTPEWRKAWRYTKALERRRLQNLGNFVLDNLFKHKSLTWQDHLDAISRIDSKS